jgi:hypothetical protein
MSIHLPAFGPGHDHPPDRLGRGVHKLDSMGEVGEGRGKPGCDLDKLLIYRGVLVTFLETDNNNKKDFSPQDLSFTHLVWHYA